MWIIFVVGAFVALFALWFGSSKKTPEAIRIAGGSEPRPQARPDSGTDSWEGTFWEVEDPFPVDAKLRLHYVDADGNYTERTVDVRHFGAAQGGNLIIGHCLLRDATRTFRVDRVQRCADAATGEVITDIHGYLRRIYEGSPLSAHDKLLVEEFDTLRVLLYVGKADAQLRAPEKAIIRDACRALATDSKLTDEAIDELLRSLDVPTSHAFKLAVNRLKAKPKEMQWAILDASKAIVATQKTVHHAEAEALDFMHKKFEIPKPQVVAQADF
jgi:hypothetical protein